jgi:uncharacterized protein (UPF0305 family)
LDLDKAGSRDLSQSVTLERYNLTNLIELKTLQTPKRINNFSSQKVDEMRRILKIYLKQQGIEDTRRQRQVEIVSIYLTFLAFLPLHPPGFFDRSGRVLIKNNTFYCPIKKEYLSQQKNSICVYCYSVG